MASSIQGNAVSYWAVKQTSPSAGVPATPLWFNLRRTSGDIDLTKSFTQSEEVDPTRQPGYNIITGSEVTGSVERELSVADPSLEVLTQSTLQNTNSSSVNSTGATTFTNGTSEISQTGAFTNAVVGQFIGAFGTASNNRAFQITSITDNDTVVVSPAPVDESVSATLNGKSYRNSNEELALAVQKRVPTDAGTLFKTFEGCQVGSFSLTIGTGSIVTLSYELLGLGKVDSDDQIAGATDNAVDGSRVSGSVKDVLEFWIDGAPVDPTGVCFTDYSVSIDNGASGQPAIGTEGNCLISFGAANISGGLTSYVDGTNPTTANSEIVKRDNETLFGLGVTMKDVDGNYLIINTPSAQYTEITQADTANGDILKNNGTFGATGKELGYAIEFNFITAP